MLQPTKTTLPTQSPMIRFIIAMTIFVVISGSAGRYFSNVFDNVEITEAETAIQSYASSVVHLHKNWILQGRPNKVTIRGLDNSGNPSQQWIFLMNTQGWPINVIDGGEKPDCIALWHALQKNEHVVFSAKALKMRRNEVGLLEMPPQGGFDARTSQANIWVCQYIVAQQLLFKYRLDTGKVEIE